MADSSMTEVERNELVLCALGAAPPELAQRVRERAEKIPISPVSWTS